jgi:flagellar assembly protein FliH
MLSKVVARAQAIGIEKMVFPQLSEAGLFAARGSAPAPPESLSGDQSVELRDKLQRFESRLATERREAFESGRAEGEQQARAELQPVLARLNASANEVLGMRVDLRRRAERDVVQLALLIAKRILHRQLAVDEEALTAIARVAFERLSRSESYRITVHPRFASAVASAIPGGHASRVQIEPDPDCAMGTFVIHSSEGTVDASLDAQLDEISRGLTDRLSPSDKS